ncbi:MAG: aspartate carbamoyltransferase regulatory subunit [Patescibacteria group bacterium]|nr:aspartate carbamoyltransferase regulatory subunit [Patescibacteria group bacterium]
MKHVISASDFTLGWVLEMIERSTGHIERFRSGIPMGHRSEKVTVVMGEASTRTAGSFKAAARLVGCDWDFVASSGESSLTKGEALGASARMWAGQGAAVLAIRTAIEGGSRWLAEAMEMGSYRTAIINAGDGANQHVSQALLDLVTIKLKKGRLENLRIGFLGDLRFSRTVHSLVQALRLFPGIELVLVSSPQVKLSEWYYNGMPATVSDSIEALAGCDIVYVTRVQEKRFGGDRVAYERVRGLYSVGEDTLRLIGPEALIMHPLPINSTDREIDPSVWMHPQVIIDFQAEMGVPTRMALIEEALSNTGPFSFPELPKPVIKVVSSGSAEEALNRKRRNNIIFTPIDCGTVIDHLPAGMGAKVRSIIRSRVKLDPGAKVLAEDLVPLDPSRPVKDIIRLENNFLPDAIIAMVAALVPGVTINEIRDGEITKKKVESVGHITVGRCPNPDCITNNDVQAVRFPKFVVVSDSGDRTLQCHYCERRFSTHEVLQ